jgi:DNA-binding response OmpR family regulator
MNIEPVHILLMEDDPGDVVLIQEGLREARLALKMVHVADGEAGMKYLRREGEYADAAKPDIILLDLNMPRKDGREVLTEIRADKRLRSIPVVILTTSDAETDIVKSYDLGANAYIKKPIGLEEFMHMMKSFEDFWLTVVRLPT